MSERASERMSAAERASSTKQAMRRFHSLSTHRGLVRCRLIWAVNLLFLLIEIREPNIHYPTSLPNVFRLLDLAEILSLRISQWVEIV